MAEQQIARSDLDYQRIIWRANGARHRAEAAIYKRHRRDFGACGFAFVVIEDKKAAATLRRLYPNLKARNGNLEIRVSCRDWQSVEAAAEIASAVANEFTACGISASSYSRMD